MAATAPRPRELGLRTGRLDFTGLGGIVSAFKTGSHTVVVETKQGREIRITAKRDLSTGAYVSEYERRTALQHGNQSHHVWSRTPAYRACHAANPLDCLEAAMTEVSRISVV